MRNDYLPDATRNEAKRVTDTLREWDASHDAVQRPKAPKIYDSSCRNCGFPAAAEFCCRECADAYDDRMARRRYWRRLAVELTIAALVLTAIILGCAATKGGAF